MALKRPAAVSLPAARPVPSISGAERRWLAVIIAVLLSVTLVPLVVAALQVPPGQVFPGYVVIARDAYVYQSLWHAGAAGDWLFRSPYTSESTPAVLLYPFYLWSGHLIGRLPSAWMYHLARVGAGGALCVGTYVLAAELYRPLILRRWAFVLAALGGGVGLLLPSVSVGSLTIRATESLSPGSSVADLVAMAPHLPLAMALMCAVFVAALRVRRGGSPSFVLGGVVAIVALQLIYPQLALLGALVVAGWAVFRRLPQLVPFTVAIGLVQLPYDLYLLAAMRSQPLSFAAVRAALEVGDPIGFLFLSHLATSLLILVALATRRLRGDVILPALWIIGMTAFMFLPGISASLGRSFMASSIPFALCATPGLLALLRGLRAPRWRRRALAVSIAAASFYGLFSLAQPIWIAAQRLDRHAEYESRDEAALLDRLAPRVSHRDLVLTTYLDGLFVPAQTNARVYAGHPDMTIDAARKAAQANDFFNRWNADQRGVFLKSNRISYVLTGDPTVADRLESDSHLRLLDREGSASLFGVTP